MILKKRFTNPETGQFETIQMHQERQKYIRRGSDRMYTELALEAIANLSPNEARVFHFMIKSRNQYNIVERSMTKIITNSGLEWSRSYTSGRLKKMIDLNLVIKENGKIWINPFIVAPKYDEDNPDGAWEIQQLWKKMYSDKDVWFDGIIELENYLFN